MNKEHRLTICEVVENLKSKIVNLCSIFIFFDFIDELYLSIFPLFSILSKFFSPDPVSLFFKVDEKKMPLRS